MARRANSGGSNQVKPRWEQTLVRDITSGEPGLFWFQLFLGGNKPVVFLFEVEDDDGELVGVHWYSPGFDNYLDAPASNKLERGTITPDPEDRIIARVDTDDGRLVKFVRNDPEVTRTPQVQICQGNRSRTSWTTRGRDPAGSPPAGLQKRPTALRRHRPGPVSSTSHNRQETPYVAIYAPGLHQRGPACSHQRHVPAVSPS